MRSTRFAALLTSLALTSMLAVPAMAQDEMAAPEPFADDAANRTSRSSRRASSTSSGSRSRLAPRPRLKS